MTDPTGLLGLQMSHFGVVPTKEPGKWRLIVDLCFPEGPSVNDGIEKYLCLLEYVTVDHIAAGVHILGKGGTLAKLDIKSAYHIVLAHPEDPLLLAMHWTNGIYIDKTLIAIWSAISPNHL